MQPKKIGETAKQTSASTCWRSHMIHIASIPSTQQIITNSASSAPCKPVDALDSACQSVPVALAAAALGDPSVENQERVFEAAFPTHCKGLLCCWTGCVAGCPVGLTCKLTFFAASFAKLVKPQVRSRPAAAPASCPI